MTDFTSGIIQRKDSSNKNRQDSFPASVPYTKINMKEKL